MASRSLEIYKMDNQLVNLLRNTMEKWQTKSFISGKHKQMRVFSQWVPCLNQTNCFWWIVVYYTFMVFLIYSRFKGWSAPEIHIPGRRRSSMVYLICQDSRTFNYRVTVQYMFLLMGNMFWLKEWVKISEYLFYLYNCLYNFGSSRHIYLCS